MQASLAETPARIGAPARGRRWVILAVMAVWCFVSGCTALTEQQIGEIQAKHGVCIDVTPAAAVADLLGGNSLVMLWNVDKELEAFPYQFKRGVRIHIAASLDLLASSRTIGDVLSTPLIGAAVQDYPGNSQGDIYVLNKDLVGTYMDLFQPSTIMWQDPHLRHELMHAYEVNTLTNTLFVEKWQRGLNERAGELDEMTHRLALVDSISLVAREDEILSHRFRPYIEFCGRWLAAAFGDVNRDGRVDEQDRKFISRNPGKFDVNNDGRITYDDAYALNGLKYSFASGIDPATQIEMTAGVFGYRPRGFASPYGRTSPWEDRAEVLAYAVRGGLLPALYRKTERKHIDRAWRRLGRIGKGDPVLARKIEILAVLLGSLETPAGCNARFNEIYAGQITRCPPADASGGR